MRHSTKMLLIPEDLYNILMRKTNDVSVAATVKTPSDMVEHSQKEMQRIVKNSHENPDAKHIKLSQEYKRYRKYAKEREDKPLSVKIDNLTRAMDKKPVLASEAAVAATVLNPTPPINSSARTGHAENVAGIASLISGLKTPTQQHALRSKIPRASAKKNKKPFLPYFFPDKYNQAGPNEEHTGDASDKPSGSTPYSSNKRQTGSGNKIHKSQFPKAKSTPTRYIIKTTKFKPQLW